MPYQLVCGDALTVLKAFPSHSADCCVTSPPYWGLRDYDTPGTLGAERTPDLYAESVVRIFREVYRVLAPRGTLWLVLGDTYVPTHAQRRILSAGKNWGYQRATAGSRARDRLRPSPGYKAKDLAGIPWLVASYLRRDGWHLRQDIIWHKTTCRPEDVHDRFVRSHEHIFLLAKQVDYFFSPSVLREPSSQKPGKTRNRRDVWSMATRPGYQGHPASFPLKLASLCVQAGCPPGGVVLDPFCGTSTTGVVALQCGFSYVGIDLSPKYIELSKQRLSFFCTKPRA